LSHLGQAFFFIFILREARALSAFAKPFDLTFFMARRACALPFFEYEYFFPATVGTITSNQKEKAPDREAGALVSTEKGK